MHMHRHTALHSKTQFRVRHLFKTAALCTIGAYTEATEFFGIKYGAKRNVCWKLSMCINTFAYCLVYNHYVLLWHVASFTSREQAACHAYFNIIYIPKQWFGDVVRQVKSVEYQPESRWWIFFIQREISAQFWLWT